MAAQVMEAWTGGDAYERFIGRWSRLVAAEFVAWLDVQPGARWVDVGCGVGALASAVQERSAPRSVVALDAAPAYVAAARAANVASDERGGGGSRSSTVYAVADARALPLRPAADVVVSGLMLNFVPTPERALAEFVRVVRPEGVVAAYVWDYAGRMELLRYFWDAAAALDARARMIDEGRRFPICRPEALDAAWRAAGLVDVTTTAIDVPTRFRDFADYWEPFLGGQGPAPSYVATLADSQREALRAALRETLPGAVDGSIALTARAWAIRGVRR